MTTDPITTELLRLAREQTDLLSSEFLAPVKPGTSVIVRLGGQWCSMMIVPPAFEGWGVFRPLTRTVALCCRQASLVEQARYVALIANIRLPEVIASTGAHRMPSADAGTSHSLGICLAAEGRKFDLRGFSPFFRQSSGDGSNRWN